MSENLVCSPQNKPLTVQSEFPGQCGKFKEAEFIFGIFIKFQYFLFFFNSHNVLASLEVNLFATTTP